MSTIIGRLKNRLCDEVVTENDIDTAMELEKYYPVECDVDDETEEGILKYSNGKSQIWVKCIYAEGEYLVSDIVMATKKTGSTKTRHLEPDEIKAIMDYFRDNGKYDELLIFVLELFLARRIGDTLSLEWGHFYYPNGNKRQIVRDLVEEKTDKIAKLHIADTIWKYIDWYKEAAYGFAYDLKSCYDSDIFAHKSKSGVEKYLPNKSGYTEEYCKAIKAQAKSFRYQFDKATTELGIEGVSTHSIRKSFGFLAHQINQFDPDCLDVLQSVYVHDSKETTKIYIDIIDDKAKKYFNDVAEYVDKVYNGEKPCIDNTPVIAVKTNDLREVLLKAYRLGMENSGVEDTNFHMEMMNKIIADVEKMRL